jgi:peptidoglycan hydrolase FlgJ
LFTAIHHNLENTTQLGFGMTPMIPLVAERSSNVQASTPLREKAAELETAFLAEMLGLAGLGAASESFGGGIGEEQFASFLRQQQAEAMVKAGGIGLAEALFRALSGYESGGNNAAK